MAKSEKLQRFQSDIMTKITQTVVDGIAAGTAPWQRPWETRGNYIDPQNLVTGKPYRGLNAFYLSMLGAGEGCDYWLGAKQGMTLGGQAAERHQGVYPRADDHQG